MWKNFTIAFAAISFQAFIPLSKTDAAQADLNSTAKFMLIGISIFLVFSFILNIVKNYQFQTLIDKERLNWRNRLYNFITDKQYSEFIETPIKEARKTYRNYVWVIGFIYLILIIILLNIALSFAQPILNYFSLIIFLFKLGISTIF